MGWRSRTARAGSTRTAVDNYGADDETADDDQSFAEDEQL